ncbi:MAG: HTTM domain-containing protein [Planctomycetaceae bacterium]|nr:HTTM domain-containing protein [Planctomycetaceae bacterium]
MSSLTATIRERISATVREAADGWLRFWFTPADPLMLGVMRILVGWMLTYNLLAWSLHLSAFFGSDGLLPRNVIENLYRGEPVFTFLLWVPDEWLSTVHVCCIAVSVLFMLGVAARFTSVAAFLITISYSQRVPVANFGLDQILGMMCLYLSIGPSGECLSIDAWLRSRRQNDPGLTSIRSGHAALTETSVRYSSSARIALRLIQLHLCVIYLWAGFAKLKGVSWWTGEAMWLALANEEYQTMDLTWMAWVPWLPYLIAHVTIIWEVYFCVLVWVKPLRFPMLLMGTLMHLGIGAFLGMWTFGLIMTFAYLSFADAPKWRQRLEAFQTRFFPQSKWLPKAIPLPSGPQPGLSPAYFRQSRPLTSAGDAYAASAALTMSMSGAAAAKTHPAGKPLAPGPVAQAESAEVSRETIESKAAGSLAKENTIPVDDASETASPADVAHVPPGLSDHAIAHQDEVRPPVPSHAEGNRVTHPRDALSDLGLSGTGVMIVSSQTAERNTLRTYFRVFDIPCRAATTAENALSVAVEQKPSAVIVSGIRMSVEEVATLVQDLADLREFPIVVLLSPLQHERLPGLSEIARIVRYPTSPEVIRQALQAAMFGDRSATTAEAAGNLPWWEQLGRRGTGSTGH